ncbi:hypothetical protein [uncultured Tateyamaria sp.]|uniref:hypothetical protein n=1 Tax=uncultured Tateyamaria sp. TaxID=455651 RepID=UPI0026053F25|nr:hypothetical protein [uncultured Tateyamaria sp.]
MSWADFQHHWRETQVGILNLPTDEPDEAELVDQIVEDMAELFNKRADRAPDAPSHEGRA